MNEFTRATKFEYHGSLITIRRNLSDHQPTMTEHYTQDLSYGPGKYYNITILVKVYSYGWLVGLTAPASQTN